MKVMRKAVHQKGFSLLELLVAVVLLSIGLLAVASMQATAINANGIANAHTVVASIAQATLEDIMSWRSDDVRLTVAAPSVAYDLDPIAMGTSLTVPGVGVITAGYAITPDAVINGVSINGVSRIDVTATGGNRTVVLSAFKRLI